MNSDLWRCIADFLPVESLLSLIRVSTFFNRLLDKKYWIKRISSGKPISEVATVFLERFEQTLEEPLLQNPQINFYLDRYNSRLGCYLFLLGLQGQVDQYSEHIIGTKLSVRLMIYHGQVDLFLKMLKKYFIPQMDKREFESIVDYCQFYDQRNV